MQEHHPLTRDFPEYKTKIHQLKTENAHFARLEKEYEDLDKEIARLLSGIEHASDSEVEQKKLRRVALKDQIYALLSA